MMHGTVFLSLNFLSDHLSDKTLNGDPAIGLDISLARLLI